MTKVTGELQCNERLWGNEYLVVLDHQYCICSDKRDGYAVRFINSTFDIWNQEATDDLLERTYGMAGRYFMTFIGVEKPTEAVEEFLQYNFGTLKLTKIFDISYLKERFPSASEGQMVEYIISDMHNRNRIWISESAHGDEFLIEDPWLRRGSDYPLTLTNTEWDYLQERNDKGTPF